MIHQYNDGGREAAGFKGKTGDCVCRAIAIATGKPYEEVYNALAEGNASQRKTKRMRKSMQGVKTARKGIYTTRKWFKDYMRSMGFVWHATMGIGTGCKVHLKAEELPAGRLVVHVSRHSTAVIDGVLHDTYDCSRDGERCVYGYWKLYDGVDSYLTSDLEDEYKAIGYENHYNPIDAGVCAEEACSCGNTPRYIGLTKQAHGDTSYIAICHCDKCGTEYEF